MVDTLLVAAQLIEEAARSTDGATREELASAAARVRAIGGALTGRPGSSLDIRARRTYDHVWVYDVSQSLLRWQCARCSRTTSNPEWVHEQCAATR